jgi:hypothetical protein
MADQLIKGEATGDRTEEGYRPQFPNSPGQYANMDGPEGEKARAWFIKNKGYQY